MTSLPEPTNRPLPALSSPLPADRNPALVYLASLSQSGRRTMRHSLSVVVEMLCPGESVESLDWSQVRYQHVQAVRARLLESYKPATVNKTLSALRRVLREAWKLGTMTAEDFHRAAGVESVKAETVPRGRMLEPAEVLELRQACDRVTAGGARDAALLAVLCRGGLRRAELVALDLDDFTEDGRNEGTLFVRAGKGRKERKVPLANGALLALAAWLKFRGDESGPLFLSVRKDGAIGDKRMSTQAVYNALLRIAKRAGVADFTPHDLRRTAGSDMLDAGADLAVVADILGHSSVDVTRRSYDRRGERAARKAAALVSFPM